MTQGILQGCPISPLIFILALEPLACAIRKNTEVMGISVGGHHFRINLNADDIFSARYLIYVPLYQRR